MVWVCGATGRAHVHSFGESATDSTVTGQSSLVDRVLAAQIESASTSGRCHSCGATRSWTASGPHEPGA